MRRSWIVAVVVVATAAGCRTTESASTQTTEASTTVTTAVATSSVAPTTTATATTSTTVESTTTTTLAPLTGLELEVVAEGLEQPIMLVSPPADPRRFVVERRGVIHILGRTEPFLDIADRVDSESGIEPGLLGLAFHPQYAVNGRFFVFYYQADAERTRLAEFQVDTDDPDRAEPDTEREILGFDKPTNRHNGGMLQFGPDGLLWTSLGEGGAASVHSQDPSTLLSSILRLDVDSTAPYAVPADNPFVNGGGAPEVWAYGLRNPWRFDIDPLTRIIYIADVGHEDREEVDAVSIDDGGHNFGWLRMEGSERFQRGCNAEAEGLTLPVLEYAHTEGCSITGGAVYRGEAIPELDGHYLYSDWCGGWLRSFLLRDGSATQQAEWLSGIGQVNGFGEDADGELYLLTWDGRILKVVPVRG